MKESRKAQRARSSTSREDRRVFNQCLHPRRSIAIDIQFIKSSNIQDFSSQPCKSSALNQSIALIIAVAITIIQHFHPRERASTAAAIEQVRTARQGAGVAALLHSGSGAMHGRRSEERAAWLSQGKCLSISSLFRCMKHLGAYGGLRPLALHRGCYYCYFQRCVLHGRREFIGIRALALMFELVTGRVKIQWREGRGFLH